MLPRYVKSKTSPINNPNIGIFNIQTVSPSGYHYIHVAALTEQQAIDFVISDEDGTFNYVGTW